MVLPVSWSSFPDPSTLMQREDYPQSFSVHRLHRLSWYVNIHTHGQWMFPITKYSWETNVNRAPRLAGWTDYDSSTVVQCEHYMRNISIEWLHMISWFHRLVKRVTCWRTASSLSGRWRWQQSGGGCGKADAVPRSSCGRLHCLNTSVSISSAYSETWCFYKLLLLKLKCGQYPAIH